VEPLTNVSLAADEPAAGPASSPPGLDERDPGFLWGHVVDQAKDGTLAVLELSTSALRRARPRSGAVSWKTGTYAAFNVGVGDAVHARGQLDASGVFVIDRLWANIENFLARVTAVDSDHLSVVQEKTGSTVEVGITDVTHAIRNDGTEVVGSASGVGVGEWLHVVSGRVSDVGDRIATRMIANANPTLVAQASKQQDTAPSDAQPAFTTAYHGVTSWFDCNGAACSPCHSCSSDLHAIAWPKVIKCNGATCGPFDHCAGCGGSTCCSLSNCCLNSTFPRHSCGACFDVARKCTGTIVRVRVRDCGPCIHCVSSACGETKVAFDLTPSAFSLLAPLSDGVIGIDVSGSFSC
jgi:hypothetical protein